ncbi:MAG: hypothetical protein U5K71_07515 [Gracilimonas sp.]|nr:hypothetical protein [Gracilimonas sp.]
MIQRFVKLYLNDLDHTQRYMIALIGSLIIFLAIFKLWPVSPSAEVDYQEFYPDEEILIDNTIITQQTDSPPPPPKPMVPIPVPNDEIIPEDIEFPDIEDVFAEESMSEMPGRGEVFRKSTTRWKPSVSTHAAQDRGAHNPASCERSKYQSTDRCHFLGRSRWKR